MISHSVEETQQIAAEIARLGGVEAVALFGGMGAGKTAFTQGLVKALGYGGYVTSPTYAIVNEYEIKAGVYVFHFDWYRLSGEDELIEIGWHDYLKRGLCVVEWSERAPGALPEKTVRVTIDTVSETRRYINYFVPNILSPASPSPGTM